MSQPERTRVSRWARLRFFAVGKYKAVQLAIERRPFERKLERIIRTALAHQSVGLPAGHPQFKLLTRQANSLCAEFTSRWNIDPNLLDAQIPAILVSLGVAGAGVFFFLLGVLGGLTSVGYHLI